MARVPRLSQQSRAGDQFRSLHRMYAQLSGDRRHPRASG